VPAAIWTWGRVTEACMDVQRTTGVVVECAGEVEFVTGSGDGAAPVFQYSDGDGTRSSGGSF